MVDKPISTSAAANSEKQERTETLERYLLKSKIAYYFLKSCKIAIEIYSSLVA